MWLNLSVLVAGAENHPHNKEPARGVIMISHICGSVTEKQREWLWCGSGVLFDPHTRWSCWNPNRIHTCLRSLSIHRTRLCLSISYPISGHANLLLRHSPLQRGLLFHFPISFLRFHQPCLLPIPMPPLSVSSSMLPPVLPPVSPPSIFSSHLFYLYFVELIGSY